MNTGTCTESLNMLVKKALKILKDEGKLHGGKFLKCWPFCSCSQVFV